MYRHKVDSTVFGLALFSEIEEQVDRLEHDNQHLLKMSSIAKKIAC
jgi:hypothetical protein